MTPSELLARIQTFKKELVALENSLNDSPGSVESWLSRLDGAGWSKILFIAPEAMALVPEEVRTLLIAEQRYYLLVSFLMLFSDEKGQQIDKSASGTSKPIDWPNMKHAAVAYVERRDGRILCCWNPRYKGWGLPGGLVEDGETQHEAMVRELKEETGCTAVLWETIWDGPTLGTDPTRAGWVWVIRTAAAGTPKEMESGCPVTWLTREEFLNCSPFAPLYEKVFAAVPLGSGFKIQGGTMLAMNSFSQCAEDHPWAIIDGPSNQSMIR